ncbi:hypothetical protein DFH06DRAFT_734994 [Mycena polygramma]|nr:hypothetical protein DFH06DRAFT_734994 [Mycena polygramma]
MPERKSRGFKRTRFIKRQSHLSGSRMRRVTRDRVCPSCLASLLPVLSLVPFQAIPPLLNRKPITMYPTADALSGLLGTPIPGTPSFELQVKGLIATSEASIAHLESLITTERGVLAGLRAAIAPIRKLPNELLVEIFLYVHRGGDVKVNWWRYKASRMPPGINKPVHRLSQVCTHWRRVAHTTPRLWVDHMKALRLQKPPSAAYVTRMKEFLERSAPLPVPVSLHSGGGIEAGPLVEVLISAAHRWSTAQLDLSSLSELSHIPAAPLKFLEKLELTVTSMDTSNHAKVQAFLTAHRLRHVTLTTPSTAQLLIPWSQLTAIDVTDPSPSDCLDILIQCTSVVTARFTTHAWAVAPDLSERQLTTLGSLEDLTVSFSGSTSGFVAPIFVRLALPALTKLKLVLRFGLTWQSAEFTQFHLRSPNIERLAISSSEMTSDDLLTILQHAPSLVELKMDHSAFCFDDSIVTGLLFTETDTIHLAPKLQTLSFLDIVKNFEEDMLDAMIRSRWWTDEQLRALPSVPHVSRWLSIRLSFVEEEDMISPDLESTLRMYRSQGLDVRVYSYYSWDE